jgi:hypothetical protein
MPRSTRRPRYSNRTPAGSRSAARPAVTPDISVWPPSARARSRAARFTAGPYQSPCRGSASPVWTPARARSPSPGGHASAAIACCTAAAAATASTGWENTENVESPSPLARTISPPAAATAPATISSWRATASDIPPASRSHNATEPTMSVNKNERGYQLPLPVGTTTYSQPSGSGSAAAVLVCRAVGAPPPRSRPHAQRVVDAKHEP